MKSGEEREGMLSPTYFVHWHDVELVVVNDIIAKITADLHWYFTYTIHICLY